MPIWTKIGVPSTPWVETYDFWHSPGPILDENDQTSMSNKNQDETKFDRTRKWLIENIKQTENNTTI